VDDDDRESIDVDAEDADDDDDDDDDASAFSLRASGGGDPSLLVADVVLEPALEVAVVEVDVDDDPVVEADVEDADDDDPAEDEDADDDITAGSCFLDPAARRPFPRRRAPLSDSRSPLLPLLPPPPCACDRSTILSAVSTSAKHADTAWSPMMIAATKRMYAA
jgi:hypothetical protein